MFDGEAFGLQMVEIVRGFVDAELVPLKAENESLKERLSALEAKSAEPVQIEISDTFFDARVSPCIAAEISKAVSAMPTPKNGTDGKDGRGVKDLLIDRDGNLVATLDDGSTKSLGPVCGKDGERGLDGRDGLGFDDMDACVLDDDRTIELSFSRGDEEKCFTFKWPTVIYRGVWREDEYSAGDAVTWGGSVWIAEKDTAAKPDAPEGGWRLAVKKGRDGKNG